MRKRFLGWLPVLLAMMILGGPCRAQANPAPAGDAPIAQRSHLPMLDPANPYSAKITAAAEALAKTLTDRQAVALSIIRGNFGAMGAVRIAEQNVSRAVDSCVKSNPEIAAPLRDRFDAWKQTVGAALGQQQQTLSRTVQGGIAGEPKRITDYLALIDHAADYAAQKQAYPPPTALPACQSLLASLDRTGLHMADLLSRQQWPTAQSLDAMKAARDAADATQVPAGSTASSLPHSLPPARPAP